MTDTQAGILLLDLAVIVALAQVFGWLAGLLGQPKVVGEILAGILVGPSLLGGISTTIFPLSVRPFLAAVADLGLVVFMFVVGMELHRPVLRGAAGITSGAVLGALLVPIGLGALLGLYLAGQYKAIHHAGLVMFIAVAMAVTAFPMLARIIADRGLFRTAVGAVALSAAAICDVVAWTLLAGVEALTGGAAPWRLVLLIPYVAVMFAVVRPALRGLLADDRRAAVVPGERLALVVIGMLASAAATQLLGLHFVFGAFLFGLVMPASQVSRASASVMNQMRLGTVALLPVYFVIAGLQVDLAHIGVRGLAQLGLITAIAVIGKFGGTFAGVRTQGLPARQSAVLGTLMNARGLTELVVLSVGLALGEINKTLYSLMVVMAIVTTVMTGPILRLLIRPGDLREDRQDQPPGRRESVGPPDLRE